MRGKKEKNNFKVAQKLQNAILKARNLRITQYELLNQREIEVSS